MRMRMLRHCSSSQSSYNARGAGSPEPTPRLDQSGTLDAFPRPVLRLSLLRLSHRRLFETVRIGVGLGCKVRP